MQLAGRDALPNLVHKTIQLVEIWESLTLGLKLAVALDGQQEGFLGYLPGIVALVGQCLALAGMYPEAAGRHHATEHLAGCDLVEGAVFVEGMMLVTTVTVSVFCTFLDEQKGQHIISSIFQ